MAHSNWKKTKSNLIQSLFRLDREMFAKVTGDLNGIINDEHGGLRPLIEKLNNVGRIMNDQRERQHLNPEIHKYWKMFIDIKKLEELQKEIEDLRSLLMLKGKDGFLRIIADLKSADEKSFSSKIEMDEKTELFVIKGFENTTETIANKIGEVSWEIDHFCEEYKDLFNLLKIPPIERDFDSIGRSRFRLYDLLKDIGRYRAKIKSLMDHAKFEIGGVLEQIEESLKFLKNEKKLLKKEFSFARMLMDLSSSINKYPQLLKEMQSLIKRLKRAEIRQQRKTRFSKLKNEVEKLSQLPVIGEDYKKMVLEYANNIQIYETDVLVKTVRVLEPRIRALSNSKIKEEQRKEIVAQVRKGTGKLFEDLQNLVPMIDNLEYIFTRYLK